MLYSAFMCIKIGARTQIYKNIFILIFSLDKITLNSLHKYVPRLNIIKVEQGDSKNYTIKIEDLSICEFIAVTAYQNENLKDLKITYNPYAKAFRNPFSTLRESEY